MKVASNTIRDKYHFKTKYNFEIQIFKHERDLNI